MPDRVLRPAFRSALVALSILVSAATAGAQGTGSAADAEIRRMLSSVEAAVQADLTRLRDQISRDLEPLAENPRVATNRMTPATLERERRTLQARVDDWSRSDAVLLDIVVEVKQLNDAVTRSEAVAREYGVEVEQYRKLYELGKKLIRQSAFDMPGLVPPERDDTLSGYYRRFFEWAGVTETALAEARERNQRYRLGLFKRTTIAYMRALLANADPTPPCAAGALNTTVQVGGKKIQTLGCSSQALAQLREYVKALLTLQSAESDTFAAQAEEVVGQQQLVVDVVGVIPYVSEALNLIQAGMGETLSGQCMPPAIRAMTAILTLVPMLGPRLVEFAARHSEQAALGIQKISAYVQLMGKRAGNAAQWTVEFLDEWARDLGLPVDGAKELFQYMQSVHINVTNEGLEIGRVGAQPLPVVKVSLKDASTKEMQRTARIYQTLQEAEAGALVARTMSQEVREAAEQESARIMSQNLERVQPGRAGVVEASNMVERHLDEFEKVAKERKEILMFRSVNEDATPLIAANNATKPMNVKPKSANWGPQRGYLPVDQKFSKLGNPKQLEDALREGADAFQQELAQIAKYQAEVEACFAKSPRCAETMALVLEDGKYSVMSVPDPAAGREMPVLRRSDGVYVHPDTKLPVQLTEAQVRDALPLEVLAVKDANGKLVPLTADYDFLAMGRQTDIRSPEFDKAMGLVVAEDKETIAKINEAAERAGYKGGKIAHHGAENWFPDSPGALAVDDVITVVDPDRGLLTIPRCDEACMVHWCTTNHQCGGVPVCSGASAIGPCIPIDPDRLLKDFVHSARMRNYNVFPNSAWDWGPWNAASGWTVEKFLAHPGVTQFMQRTSVLREATWRFLVSGTELAASMFSCEAAPLGDAR